MPVESFLIRQIGKDLFDHGTLREKLQALPTLLWIIMEMDIAPDTALELLALLGSCIAFLALWSETLRTKVSFALLWLCYFSLVQVGQTFLWFQWDSLLLELGALIIFLAPWTTVTLESSYDPIIPMALLRFLLFRLLFASGVVKLTSMCPTWWDLSALYWHFESQCIPSPVAWYARKLPEWALQTGVAATYLFLMAGGAFALVPLPGLRVFGFFLSIALQVFISITGNYNFFNIVTMVLSLSMLSDDLTLTKYVTDFPPNSPHSMNTGTSMPASMTATKRYRVANALSLFASAFVGIATMAWWWRLFDAKIDLSATTLLELHTQITFTKEEFLSWVDKVTLPLVYLAAASLALSMFFSLKSAFRSGKLMQIISTFLAVALGASLFLISAVPFSWISHEASSRLPSAATVLYEKTQHLQLAHSYGLFRRMTGIGGRPEVVVEVTRDLETWTELDFKYKVNNITAVPPIIVPHQPRLDWQMWFAALGTFDHNPWLVNLAIKLMRPAEPVLRLLPAAARNSIEGDPPIAVRMRFYKYHFTDSFEVSEWWWREEDGMYMTRLENQNPWCDNFLAHYGYNLPLESETQATHSTLGHRLTALARTMRQFVVAVGDSVSLRFGEDILVPLLFWCCIVLRSIMSVISTGRDKRVGGNPKLKMN